MKYEIFHEHKVWHKGEVQRITVFRLQTASTEFSRLMRQPGTLYVKLFENNKLIAQFCANGI